MSRKNGWNHESLNFEGAELIKGIIEDQIGRFNNPNKKATRIELSLEEILKMNKGRIHHVCLLWLWDMDYYTDDLFDGADIYQRVFDREYCFIGDYEDALKYAKQYDQWNGYDFLLKDGVLFCKTIQNDMQISVNDGYTHGLRDELSANDVGRLKVYEDYDTDTTYWIDGEW